MECDAVGCFGLTSPHVHGCNPDFPRLISIPAQCRQSTAGGAMTAIAGIVSGPSVCSVESSAKTSDPVRVMLPCRDHPRP
jgi:hypothetical protein